MKDFLYPLASMSTLAFMRDSKRKRISSYDRTGGNDDRVHICPGENRLIADIHASGCINHIWCTLADTNAGEAWVGEENAFRKIVIRMYWDGEENPSVEVPIGDFFGMGHAMCKNYVSAPLQMSPEDGKGFNCWFPMPFASNAKIEIFNECDNGILLYFYIDYEEYRSFPEGLLRFHATWNRECPTQGYDQGNMGNMEWLFGGEGGTPDKIHLNTTGDENYVLLEAEGRGHYVGCNVNIHNLRDSSKFDWPGCGDDMIFIDGEKWPPNLHGTGTEDYFNTAWCPYQEYDAPYHGILLGGKDNWKGKISYYRYHIQDPVMFEKSIRVTIEHGHNNNRTDDWSSTAYWYQTEPHKKLKVLPQVKDRLPIKDCDLVWEWKYGKMK